MGRTWTPLSLPPDPPTFLKNNTRAAIWAAVVTTLATAVVGVRSVSSAGATAAAAAASVASALTRARALNGVLPDRQNTSTTNGEEEAHDWWVNNAELLEEARREYGPKHAALYDFASHVASFIQPQLLSAIEECEQAAAAGEPVDETRLLGLLSPAGPPSVYRLPLFTEEYCTLMLEEVRHYEASGIPLRRPNGMNRYGAILDHLGMEASLDYLSRRFLRPLGQLLYPWLISKGDADEHYAFTVRYKPGEDVSLAGHYDASVLTLNANLGIRGFTGGAITFRGTRFVDDEPQRVPESQADFADFAPGDAILHLGGQYHSALPTTSGERSNMIVWLHGKHEVVRVAAHDEADRLSARQRWAAFGVEEAGRRFKDEM